MTITVLHPITGLDIGGAETMLVKLVRTMDPARFRSVVVSLTSIGAAAAPLSGGLVSVEALRMTRAVPDPRVFFRLRRLLHRYRPDVVQTWLYHADLLGILAAGRRPVLWNLRCSDMDLARYGPSTRLVRRLLVALSSRPRAIVVNSARGEAVHRALGYRARRWVRIPNGFDVERFRPDPTAPNALRAELGIQPDSLLVGLPARLDPMKDHVTFLAAAAHLAEHPKGPHFVLIGAGTDESPTLERWIAEFGLGNRIHRLGLRSDMPRVLAGLDVVVLSSAFGEGFPNVLGEAMAAGVPCVTTDVGDAAAIVGPAGRVVPPRDPLGLTRAVAELLDLDASSRRGLGVVGRARVCERFSLAGVAASYESLYEENAAAAWPFARSAPLL